MKSLKTVLTILYKREEITKIKRWTGGWLINGNMCVGIYENLLVCRIDSEIRDKLIREPDITYFTNEEANNFISVTNNIYRRDKALHKFLNHAAKYTAALPPKESST